MSASSDDRDAVHRDFREAVTMTPKALSQWLDTEESQAVGQKDGDGESVGHESGRRIVTLLQKPKRELDDDDLAHMRKVVGYVHRHLAQRPAEEAVETSRWRYSLMNWGHDPLAGS